MVHVLRGVNLPIVVVVLNRLLNSKRYQYEHAMNETFDQLCQHVLKGRDLTQEQMKSAIDQIMTGKTSERAMGDFLRALSTKGETVAELAGAASAMRANMKPIRSKHKLLLDTCGTGGGGSKTFNISTAAALVIAAAGVPVAKHGNRSVTSRTGSADVLAELGVNIAADVPQVERCLNELGVCFCFAPLMHPAMKNVAEVRKQLGIRTIFNLLGPLANPAGASFQLLGVGRPEFRNLVASALQQLGAERAMVVSGSDGLGEVTLTGSTQVTEVTHDGEQEFEWQPEVFGLIRSSLEALEVKGPEQSAQVIREVLEGKQGPPRNVVILNAAAGLLVARKAATPLEAAELAAHVIDEGHVASLLADLVRVSHEAVNQ